MVLLHVDARPVQEVIIGRLYTVPPNEPTEIPDDIGETILRHKSFQGLVKVQARRDKSGVHYDLDAAMREARKALEAAELATVNNYIRTQIEDRLRKNFPALPPEGRAKEIIERRGIDLRAYGVAPVGMAPAPPVSAAQNDEIIALRKESEGMRAELAEIRAMLRSASRAPLPPPAAPRPAPGQPIASQTRG